MAYHDKYKKILDEVWKDKVELDGKIVNEEEEAVKRIKGEALKEKEDLGAFIFPIRLEEDMKKVDRGITMIDHTQAKAMGMLTNVLCQVGVTTLIAKYLILDILIDRNSPIVIGRGFLQSDSDDEEDYQIKRNKFGAPIYGPKLAPYLNCNNPDERSIAIKPLKEHTMMRQDHQDPNTQDNMKPWKSYCFHKFTMSFCYGKDVAEMKSLEIDDILRIRLRKVGSDDEIFILVSWIRAFNINESIYAKLCYEFYSTYEFDEVCADDELQSKKIIKFRLGGRAHNLTLLEFARRLGLYQAVELEEEGFNTTGYDKIQKNDLWLLSMFDARHQNGYANVAWVIARWIKRKGAGTQKESQICCGQFISKIAKKCRVLTEDVIMSLSALIYCRDLDTITLRDLIDSEGKLIPEDPQPGVPRVGIPRPPRASMQDLYDRMGRIEIRQDAIERMEYRQSYHWTGIIECLSIWMGFIVFHCREPTTHLAMLSRSMTSTISSIRLRHNSSRMMLRKKKKNKKDEKQK
ncbi:hypothetical protein Tco_0303709 [Tanacetum coccineum]